MNKIKIMKKIVILVILISLVLIIAIFIKLLYKKYNVYQKQQRLEQLSESIQPLLEEVKNVMEGKILVEDERNPLVVYGFEKEINENVQIIDANIQMKNIICTNENWYIRVKYYISYEDKGGELLRYAEGEPTWRIQKKAGEWFVVERCGIGDFTIDKEWENFGRNMVARY